MRRLTCFLLAAAAVAAVRAQPAAPQNYEAMLATLQAAEAAARQPGDESLDCDALAEQLAAAMNDEAVQAYFGAAGVTAQEDIAKLDDAQKAGGGAKPHLAAQAAAGFARAMIPGGNMGSMIAGAAQARAAQAGAAERIQQAAQQMEQMMAIMPKLMRGQRLAELAGAKQCDWMAGAEPPASPAGPQR